MLNDNIKIAIASLKSAKWRSLLTMLGVIMGVISVVTVVSLGEGLRREVSHQLGSFGKGFIAVQPGQTVKRDKNGKITDVNVLPGLIGSSLTEQDVQTVSQTAGISATAPLGILSGVAETEDRQLANTPIIATASAFPDVMNRKISYGGFFGSEEDTKQVAIIGKSLAIKLFAENVPIGRSFRLRGQSFLVRGVFEDFPTNPLLLTVDFNGAIFVPYGAAKNLLNSPPPIYQIFAKTLKTDDVDEVGARLTNNLLNAHAGQADFTVLSRDENIEATGGLLQIITQVVAAIAGVSLLIGGVGIMNIMLVAVTERTREIGIRKAVGATNRQIRSQFVIEAGLLSLVGGIVGVLGAYLVDFLIRLFTSLQPVIPLWIIGLSIGVALITGVLFGVAPALKAARKDPIEALRYE